MDFRWKLLIVFGICAHTYTHAASVATSYPRRLGQHNAYLPPYSSTNFADKTHTTVSYTTHTAQNKEPFRRGVAVDPNMYKSYTSYAPPPSGAASFQYSTPQATSNVPLSSLVPQSVLAQLSTADVIAQQQQLQDENAQMDSELNTPVLLVEEPPTMWLTPSQNKTLQTAKLLASTLLEANGEAALELNNGHQLVNPSSLQDPNQLNTTDVVIVRSHKNAYIIPAQLAQDARGSATVRELYQRRSQLERAYTINQFIFIIKPEKINFLNKLV